MAKKIHVYWNSYNGPGDARGNYIEYDHFVVLVKFNEPFTKTAYQSQLDETKGTPGGGDHKVMGVDDLVTQGMEDTDFFIPDEENTKLEQFEAYKFTFDAPQNGQYFFSVWAFLEGEAYGPSYYPPRLDIQDGSGEFVENNQGIIVDSDLDTVDLSDTLNIYGLTVAGSNGKFLEVNDTSGEKDSKDPLNNAIEIRNTPDPNFKFFATLSENGSTGNKEINFKGRARITIRPPSASNIPSPNIFYEFYDVDIGGGPNESFTFNSFYNSYIALGNIPEGQKHFEDTKSSFIITDKLTIDNLPLRHFDVVVEGYNSETLKTSAGNNLHDNVKTEQIGLEGDFKKEGIPGYDICEVKLLAPEGLIFLQEYSLRDGFVTPQQAFDKKIPYIIEPRITDDGNIDLIFIRSFKETESIKTESEIIDEFIDPLAGVVVYYSDEPFALNTEEINIRDGFEQKVTVDDKVVTVKREFVLAEDFNTDKGDHILSIPFVDPFARKEIKSQNIIIAGFDELLYVKHFVNDKPLSEKVKVDDKSMDVPTILGEKELSFSQTVPGINDFKDENGDSTNDFNKAVKSTSSIQMFKKAPVDEGFRAQSYRCYAYIDFPKGSIASRNVDHYIIGQNNLDLQLNKDNTELTINFREQLDYIPVILPYIDSDSAKSPTGLSAVNDSSPIDVRLGSIDQTSTKIHISKTTSGNKASMKLFVGFLAIT